MRLEDNRFVFRVEVIGRKLTIEDILGPDYLKGPMPAVAGGMTHQEFLDLVTPKDVQGYAAFTNGEALDRRGHIIRHVIRSAGAAESHSQVPGRETGA